MRIEGYSRDSVRRAVGLLRAGEVVVFAPSTVYALMADATRSEAIDKIYAIKRRQLENPMMVIVHDLPAAERIASFDRQSRLLAERFWPGPLTLVLPLRSRAKLAPACVGGGGESRSRRSTQCRYR